MIESGSRRPRVGLHSDPRDVLADAKPAFARPDDPVFAATPTPRTLKSAMDRAEVI